MRRSAFLGLSFYLRLVLEGDLNGDAALGPRFPPLARRAGVHLVARLRLALLPAIAEEITKAYLRSRDKKTAAA